MPFFKFTRQFLHNFMTTSHKRNTLFAPFSLVNSLCRYNLLFHKKCFRLADAILLFVRNVCFVHGNGPKNFGGFRWTRGFQTILPIWDLPAGILCQLVIHFCLMALLLAHGKVVRTATKPKQPNSTTTTGLFSAHCLRLNKFYINEGWSNEVIVNDTFAEK